MHFMFAVSLPFNWLSLMLVDHLYLTVLYVSGEWIIDSTRNNPWEQWTHKTENTVDSHYLDRAYLK